MTRGRQANLLLALTLLLGMILSGCVSVPISGPPEKIEGQAPDCQNCVSVEVAPPTPGEDAKSVASGYLRATSNYQPNYTIARQFLTRAAAERWSAEDGALIYSGAAAAIGKNAVVLDGLLLGSLGPDRAFTARNERLRINFGMVKEDGEWRISKPPPGLLVAEYSFLSFYKSYNLYFIGNGSNLVPDPIYLPNLPNQANIASVLTKSLLTGPSKWLKPAVTSAIPDKTALSVDSVTVKNGVAEVPLSDTVLPLNDRQRSLMAAQVVFTLKQATGVNGVLFTVNQQPFRVPGGDPDSFEVAVDSIPADVNPIPTSAGEQLYAVRGKAVQLVDPNAGAPSVRAFPGPLGAGKYEVSSLAVSVPNTDLALVTDDRTVLRRVPTAGGAVTVLDDQVSGLIRPQFSRYGELWAIGRSAGRQHVWVFNGDKVKVEVATPILAAGEITAFRISPDGTRIALVRVVGKNTELGLGRINRSDKVTLDGWRRLATSQPKTPALTRIRDVGWLDDTDLMVLGAPNQTSALVPYRLSEDGSRIVSEGEPNNWDAVELTILLRSQTAVILGRRGQTWKDDGTQWLPFIDRVTTLAFPG